MSDTTPFPDPGTDEEWQKAVDAAHGCLVFDASRKYGFVTGGPQVNVSRCEDILRRGAARGVTPRADSVERFVAELVAGGDE